MVLSLHPQLPKRSVRLCCSAVNRATPIFIFLLLGFFSHLNPCSGDYFFNKEKNDNNDFCISSWTHFVIPEEEVKKKYLPHGIQLCSCFSSQYAFKER